MLDAEVTIIPEFAHSASHAHAKCTDIAASAAIAGGIDELDILGLVDEEVEGLNLVIDACGNDRVWQGQVQLLVQITKGSTTRNLNIAWCSYKRL